jgi:hypothetical protein
VAIHSTYWHNNFGEPISHGCVNVRPEDAMDLSMDHAACTFETGDNDVTVTGSEFTNQRES